MGRKESIKATQLHYKYLKIKGGYQWAHYKNCTQPGILREMKVLGKELGVKQNSPD